MKRFISINAVTGSSMFDYDGVFKQSFEDVDTIVDKSHFMPHSSVLSALEHGYSSNSNLGSYDDPNSLSSGKIPINRRYGQTITEVYCEAQKVSSELKDKVDKIARKRRDEEIVKKAFSVSPNNSPSSDNTSSQ